jgi:hypothetical protein
MNDQLASDEVTDSIAHIEMHRQEAVKDSGLAHACSEALRKLQELLEQVKTGAEHDIPPGSRPINVEAVTQEIRKVKGMAGNANHNHGQNHGHNHGHNAGQENGRQQRGGGQPQQQQPRPPHGQPRNKGRRSMGRNSGRKPGAV